MEKLDVTQADQDTEIALLNTELNRYQECLSQKLDVNEGTKFWKHFQRFAEYSDLKSLHNKVIPELAKFEQKIINFESEKD